MVMVEVEDQAMLTARASKVHMLHTVNDTKHGVFDTVMAIILGPADIPQHQL